ncbi:Endo-1,4-beta-xylanase D [Madurella mycetomatis]|uniref:Beta-xylanase n=1 Tax=Madurella mycetomatis TaxID=100816 RepID=A0A175W202_9PEZI|nr:Endo-1,4-beta-xylanase D [Madurella mycetomatis]
MARLTGTILMISGLLVSAGRPSAAQEQAQGLHSLMVAAGKLYFGTATETNNFDDAAYQAISTNANEFGMLTPENSQKWEVTQPRQGEFVFTGPDAIAEKAAASRQLLRCHTLTWHSQLPSFVQTTAWTPETLTAVIQTHITNVMTHFAGRCYAWDVVNEALNENGTFRESVFLTTLGDAYIPLSFSVAAAADPDSKLYYNDFNLETSAAKADGAARIVGLVRDAGARIDGVGFQAHLTVGQTPSRAELAALLARFAALEVEVAFTELDIAHAALPATDVGRAQQAVDYVAAVGACLDVAACVGVTVWQFTDKFSWVPSTFPGKGDACLFTADYVKKPAYEAVFRLLEEAAGMGGGNRTGHRNGNGNGNGSGGGACPAVDANAASMAVKAGQRGGAGAAASTMGSGADRIVVAATAVGLGGMVWAVVFFAL